MHCPPFVGIRGDSGTTETLFARVPPQISLPLPPQLCVLFVERIRLGLSPQKQKLPDCVPAKKKFREAQVARHFALVIVVDRVTEPERSLELIFFGTRELGDSAVPVSAKHPKAPFGFAGCATASGLMHT